MSEEMIRYTGIQSMIGRITLLWQRTDRIRIMRLVLPVEHRSIRWKDLKNGGDREIDRLINAIYAYLKGAAVRIPLDLLEWSKCSAFQKEVLMNEWLVPFGRVIRYQDLAMRVRDRRYSRAAAMALAGNPFPIIIPCHRAVRTDRSLGGYRGGIKMKRWLIENEGISLEPTGRMPSEYFWKFPAKK